MPRDLRRRTAPGSGAEAGGGTGCGLQGPGQAGLTKRWQLQLPAEGTLNKSSGQFHPFHGPEFGLFIYGPGHAVGVQSSQERHGKGDTEAERVNRQQLSWGKAFQKQRIHRHSLLLLLLSLNSWRKCLIKIFVLLCLSEMTYDSSLSQTPNSHSICHSHPTRDDSHSPRKMERRGGEDMRWKAAGIRPQTFPAPPAQAPSRQDGRCWWERQVAPEPSPPSVPQPGARGQHPGRQCPRKPPARTSPLRHLLARLFGKLSLLIRILTKSSLPGRLPPGRFERREFNFLKMIMPSSPS